MPLSDPPPIAQPAPSSARPPDGPTAGRTEKARRPLSVEDLLPYVVYPESDGLPMADNSKQLRWIFVLYGNLAALFRDAADVFVGGNQFWYPLEGHPELCLAPDVYVVFGRPKGDRGSYQQWKEGGVPLTVVFEVLSPGNTIMEMAEKLAFYDEHGVEEYYVYDPDSNRLLIYCRKRETLVLVRPVAEFVSPRLGIRFDTSGPELVVLRPDGQRFLTFEEMQGQLEGERAQHQAAEQRAAEAQQQRLAIEQRIHRLAALSRKARRQQASAEELAELERLEQPEEPSS